MFPGYEKLFSQFLVRSWTEVNRVYLNESLSLPVFRLSKNEKNRLGSWDAESRTITIAAELFVSCSEMEILEIIKHEMAHQYASEVLESDKYPDEKPHGSAFQHACKILGIEKNAQFNPSREPSPIIQKIQKLFALAESHNQHEAELALAKAHQLIAKYELDMGFEDMAFCYDYLGKPLRQRSAVHQFIAQILVRFFHVRPIWVPSLMVGHSRTVWAMEVSGSQTNIEIAGYVYDFLIREVDMLWNAHRTANPHLRGKTPKRDFQIGVLRGLIEKLSLEEEIPSDNPSGYEMVLVKQEKLDQFFADRHPSRKTGRPMTYRQTPEYQAGYQQGQVLDIHRGIKGKNEPILEDGRKLEAGAF